MKFFKCLILIFLMLPVFSAHAIKKAELIGTWRLQSYTILEGGKESNWCREAQPYGLISYLSNGYMAVGINCRDTAGKIVANPKDMVFYTGTYTLKDKNQVIHQVENSSELSRIAQTLIRTAQLEKGILTLTGQGTKGQVKLVWEKIK